MRAALAKRSERGACLGGCLLLALAVLLLLGAVVWGGLSAYQGAYAMTSPTPRDVSAPPTPAELRAAQGKLDSLREGLRRRDGREVALTSADLNAWLWTGGGNTLLEQRLRLRVEGEWLVGEVSVPLGFARDLPFLPGLRSRWFNGRIAARLAVEKGELVIKAFDVEGNGKRLPWLFTGNGYRQAIIDGIKGGVRARLPGGNDVLDGLQSVRIENDIIYLKVLGDRV